MHDNFKTWKEKEKLEACTIKLVDGQTVHVYNQPFMWPGSMAIHWPAQTDNDERGFLVDGKALVFWPLIGGDSISVEFDPEDGWLDKLRQDFYGPLEPPKCVRCGSEDAYFVHQPIQTYETHMAFTLHEHLDMEGASRQVAMCRQCAIKYAKASIAAADPEKLTFYV